MAENHGFIEDSRLDRIYRQLVESGDSVIRQIARSFPQLGVDGAEDAYHAVVTAWRLTASPGDGAPGRAFLRFATRRKALDLVTSKRARESRQVEWAILNGVDAGTGLYSEGEMEARRYQEVVDCCAEILPLLPDDRMRAVFGLRLAGKRSTEAFALALGLDRLPKNEAADLVEKEKDRLRKYLRANHDVRSLILRLVGGAG